MALVTGAGHGIGKEIVLELARKGAKLVLWDINKANNDKTAAQINIMGGSATSYVIDVADADDIHRTAKQIRREVGDVDILVNNAGILYGGELLKLKEAHIRRTFDVNTLAHFLTVKEFLPAMIEKNCGHIVTIASMVAKSGTAYMVDYSASKYAVYGFTEALSEELMILGKNGVKTTTVCPSFVSTGLVKQIRDKITTLLTPDTVAVEVVKGIQYEEEHVYVPRILHLGLKLQIHLLMVSTTLSTVVIILKEREEYQTGGPIDRLVNTHKDWWMCRQATCGHVIRLVDP
ncbi:17-beta-hydroxysteroid dehydrogenase 13,Epidermal retinol dehydrogenase 2,Estradiol 17-beta-dehydrogenase 11,Protein dhs-3 [Mytilus coruscus]|uniref:Short-chain dehydrogenase/reductase 3 n=1 Tax=Mytilus coruscus TaxID=42192 RepID=A0A6J8ADA3_MYTCO|nr:17-beta-hydroxysteroid dehydrogenase 13,Epidermal retinol dehydrogenase 2,Estradiol 17-beta-dehydrogenase 11,Protein dhs-3 [Mytilus coruscus]